MRISDWIQTCALPICPSRAGSDGYRGASALREDRRFARSAGSRQREVSCCEASRLRPGSLHLVHRLSIGPAGVIARHRSEEHTSELQSLMRISYAVFCLKKKKKNEVNTSKVRGMKDK